MGVEIKDRMKRDLIATWIKKGFEDEEDLYFYIEQILGYTIPRKKFCPEHISPWNFIRDIFFDKVRFCFAYGARGAGKTMMIALNNHLKMMYKQCPIDITLAAATLDQADKGYAHFLSFFSDPMLRPFVYQSIKSKTTLLNNSELIITSGTMKGLNGAHSQICCLDELELMDYSLLGEALSISMSKKDKVHDRMIPSLDIWASTRKRGIGTVSRILEESEEKNMAIYCFCCWETLEKCTRKCEGDKDWGDCVIWDKCQGRAHDTNGWYPIADFIQKVVNLPKPTFEAQWENKSPSGGPKVFGSTWDEKIHVLSWVDGGIFKSFHSIFHEKEIPKEWRKIGGMDFGSNFYYGSIAIEPKYGIWIVFFEYFYKEERLMATHGDKIIQSPYFMQIRRIYGDPSAKQGIIDMNDILKKKAKRKLIYPALNALIEGVDAFKKKLEVSPSNGLPGIFVMDTCIELRREMRGWEHEVLPDGKPDLDSFEDGNDHGIDSIRYSIYSTIHRDRVSYRFATVKGV